MKLKLSPNSCAEPFDDIQMTPMPNPTKQDLESDDFLAVWEVIKHWDISSPEHYNGRTGANGSHVMLILEKLRPVVRGQKIDELLSKDGIQ